MSYTKLIPSNDTNSLYEALAKTQRNGATIDEELKELRYEVDRKARDP